MKTTLLYIASSCIALISFCLLPLTACSAQEYITEHVKTGLRSSGDVSVADLAWIAGSWEGEALGGFAEEVWSEPSGGTMLGMFKLSQDGATVFSELMMIVPDSNSVKMILKHFDPDLTGWEEKSEVESFSLLSLTDNAAYFDGLTIEKRGNRGLAIYVVMHAEDGSMSELAFEYARVQNEVE